MKPRSLLGTAVLDEAKKLYSKGIPVSVIYRLLDIQGIGYRTALNIIMADIYGFTAVSRPSWVQPTPMIQTAPQGWFLRGGMNNRGYWEYIG